MQDLVMDETKTIAGGYEWFAVELVDVLIGELTLAGLVDPNLLPTPWVPSWLFNPFVPPPSPENVEPIVGGIMAVAYYNPAFDWDGYLWDMYFDNPPPPPLPPWIPPTFPPEEEPWWNPYDFWYDSPC